MRLPGIAVALALLAPAHADSGAGEEGARFRKVVDALLPAINAGDTAAIDALFTQAMREALPREKAGPFFRGVVAQKGKLVRAGEPRIEGDEATFPLEAERGAWELRLALDREGRVAGLRIVPPPAPILDRKSKPLALPFRGEWYVFWGGDSEEVNYHVTTRNQRRAADLVRVDAAGRSHRGDGKRLEDYYAYGEEVLAPEAGSVVTVIDGVPDNTPGSMNPYSAMGNCVILELDARTFAVLAHFKPGSLRVKAGEKVRRGQVLGLCGNSGNSSEPHLHFHLQDTAVLQDGTGLTAIFQGVEVTRGVEKSRPAEYVFLRGDRLRGRDGR